MKITNLFTKTLRKAPSDETAVNAQLLIRGGFITKVMAGVYEYMPLGWKVLNKINTIIREEMDATGAQELYMSVMQSKETWTTTGRWDTAKEVMYQFKDVSQREIGLGWTHEEPLTAVARHFISSYKDLPKMVYQIQTKFRNEPRAKSGLLRGREFLMKDLYSFHTSQEDLDPYYERVALAYSNIFKRVGLDARRTLASGGLFSKFSDEFQVLSPVGEDKIYYCANCQYTANIDVAKDMDLKGKCPECGGSILEGQSIEVGNIFKLGIKFSEAFGLHFTDKEGSKQPVIMASYGIGPGRVMGTAVEMYHDEKGIVWPDNIAPFRVHLIVLDGLNEVAEDIYHKLQHGKIDVLFDDRPDISAGEKFADADLIGCPVRMVISKRTIESESVEIKIRKEKEQKLIKINKIMDFLES